jgi:hypothetical protein
MNEVPIDIRSSDGMSTAERRAALQAARERKAAARRIEIEQLASATRTPAERIESWERMHELRMPDSLKHPLVRVIAAATALTMDEMRAEQIARRRTWP